MIRLRTPMLPALLSCLLMSVSSASARAADSGGQASSPAASGWSVAIPPFRAANGTVVVDTAAPLDEWMRHGSFPTEADCRAEIGDEAARESVARRMMTGTIGAGLTDALRDQVLEAIRRARCVERDG
jgi:hypothetical protein